MFFSIIIPAYRETSSLLLKLVDHVKIIAGERNCEIIIVLALEERDSVVELERSGASVITSGRGRARQMNAGARATQGDVLVFLHADCQLPEGACGSIANALTDSG